MMMAGSASTIVTLALDPANQKRFDDLRRSHYPAHLNRIAAHLTLFHALPATDEIREVIHRTACTCAQFEMRVSGVISLGRGTAYSISSPELLRLHADLGSIFKAHLSAQDRQRFKPHIVVQNKVSGEDAKSLQVELAKEFSASNVHAMGLEWWNYLGGPWELREVFRFPIATGWGVTAPK